LWRSGRRRWRRLRCWQVGGCAGGREGRGDLAAQLPGREAVCALRAAQHFPLRLATRHLPTITCRLPQCHAELELEKLCLHQLNAAAKDFMAAGGGATPLAALALACLPAEHAAEAGDSSAAGGEEAGSDAGGCSPGVLPSTHSLALGCLGAIICISSSTAISTSVSVTAAGSDAAGSSPGHPSSASNSSRSSFMHRAFARQPAGNSAGGGSTAYASASGPASGGGLGTAAAAAGGGGAAGTPAAGAAPGAFAVFQQRVREFNACVPYMGPLAGEGSSAAPWALHGQIMAACLLACMPPAIAGPCAASQPMP
jgi:hypothetical protein